MVRGLFSKGLPRYNRAIENDVLMASLQELLRYLQKKSLKILIWNETHIAIPLDISVDLPPLGNYECIDIRSTEPVLIVINCVAYPNEAPLIYTDRLDFPKDQLAHLYIAVKEKPPAFCLIRGDINEWYSNKRLKDLIFRTENWLRDAAAGLLTEDGSQFDPLRLEGYYGAAIYDYDLLFEIVKKNASLLPNSNVAVGLFDGEDTKDGLYFKLVKIVTMDNFDVIWRQFEKENDSDLPFKKHCRFGHIVWSDQETSFNHYSVHLPNDWESLKLFCASYAIDLTDLERHIAEYKPNIYIYIPIIIGIKRPKNLIGFNGNIEFINFCFKIESGDIADGKIINNISIRFQRHNQPLTLQKAREISGFCVNSEKPFLVIGCGALGSKIVMHLTRSGFADFLLADQDSISPHNLVRYALFANSEGMNKAFALAKEIKKIYTIEQLEVLPLSIKGGLLLNPEMTKTFSFIFDFAASNYFSQQLVVSKIDEETRVCKAFISDLGNLGMLFFEGNNRNPRIDDLQVILYTESRKLEFISSWLKRESESNQSNINVKVGIGCNSETIVLADDIVSLHAAFFSGVIKTESHKVAFDSGKIYLNEIRYEPFFHNAPSSIDVFPLDILHAINDPSWQIRIFPGIIQAMQDEMDKAMPHETGGVFIGCANFKTKTVHVVELIKAPADSQADPVCFFRGIQGLPQTIQEINDQSGNQLGYIGEWHSHPYGPEELSDVDMATVEKFKSEFDSLTSPLPVFIMIVTPDNLLPFIF